MKLRGRTPLPLPTEPDCAQVGAVLQSYVDGELGAEDADIVAAHLEHCERCDIEAATVSKVVDAIRRQRPDLAASTMDRLTGFVDRLTSGGPPTTQ